MGLPHPVIIRRHLRYLRTQKAGTARSSVVSDHLEENLQGANIDEEVIKDVAANAYAGESRRPRRC